MTCSYQWNNDRGMIRQWSDHDPTLTWASHLVCSPILFSRLGNLIFVSKRSMSRFVYFKNFTTCCACHEKWRPQYQNVLRLPELMTFMQNLPQTWNAYFNGKSITSHLPTLSHISRATKIVFMLHLRHTWNVQTFIFTAFLLFLFCFLFFFILLCPSFPIIYFSLFFLVFVSLPYFLFPSVYFFLFLTVPECSYIGNSASIAKKGLLINSDYRFLNYLLKLRLGTGPVPRVIDYVKWWLPHWRAQGYGHEITHAASKLLYGWWWWQIFRARQKISGFSGCIMCCVEENYIFLGPWWRLIFSVF